MGKLRRSAPFAALVALALLLPATAAADTVYLTNGRSFEDVVAEVGEDEVTIHLSFGTMRLPASRIERVESGDSSVAEYRSRVEQLRRSSEPDAADWIELALWARTRGLDHGVREAATTAAGLDPRHADLEPLMRSLGYVYEPELGRWIPFDELMRRQGFVRENGLWVGREELDQRRRMAELERDRAERERQAAREAAREAELDLLRQQLLLQATAPPPTYYQPPIYASWVGWGPVVTPPIAYPPLLPPGHPHPLPGTSAHYRAANRAAIVSSQPGSLLPILPRVNYGSTTTLGTAGN
jgi:hypothetical protein